MAWPAPARGIQAHRSRSLQNTADARPVIPAATDSASRQRPLWDQARPSLANIGYSALSPITPRSDSRPYSPLQAVAAGCARPDIGSPANPRSASKRRTGPRFRTDPRPRYPTTAEPPPSAPAYSFRRIRGTKAASPLRHNAMLNGPRAPGAGSRRAVRARPRPLPIGGWGATGGLWPRRREPGRQPPAAPGNGAFPPLRAPTGRPSRRPAARRQPRAALAATGGMGGLPLPARDALPPTHPGRSAGPYRYPTAP